MTPTGNQQTRVLLVMSSVDEMGLSGKQTGTWFQELAAPYYILTDAGYEVAKASAVVTPLRNSSAIKNVAACARYSGATKRFSCGKV